jgi:hypothetical protein
MELAGWGIGGEWGMLNDLDGIINHAGGAECTWWQRLLQTK